MPADQEYGDPLTRKLHSTTDAMIWAEEFVGLFEVKSREDGTTGTEGDQVGLMVGWFANAIEIGRSAGREK